MKVCVIGSGGHIGGSIITALTVNEPHGCDLELVGVDKGDRIPEANVYIIATPDDQILSVLKGLNYDSKPLVIIESTVNPVDFNEIKELLDSCKCYWVIFPHRWWAGNEVDYGVFQDRVMGGKPKDLEKAINFYSLFCDTRLINAVPDAQLAMLSKIVENAYRFYEIAFAEELRANCSRLGISFNKLRELANTKWNIDIKDARDGIGLHCIPKDSQYYWDFFGSLLMKMAKRIDKAYIKWRGTDVKKLYSNEY